MLQTQAIEPGALSILNGLSQIPALGHFFLVGGTALALKYGHRISIDLDLFSHSKFNKEEILTILQNEFGKDFRIEESKANWAVFCYIRKIKVDLIKYDHSLLSKPEIRDGIRMYHDHDLMAMKVNAIMGRGTKKDFYDIYELLHHYPLSSMIDCYHEKFPSQMFLISVPSALIYFTDANASPDPTSLKGQTWNEVKSFIREKVNEYLR